MIDRTEKPKIPSNFAKRTARFNEFHCKRNQGVHQVLEIGEFSIYYAKFSDLRSVAYEYFLFTRGASFKIFSGNVTPFSCY